MTATRHSQRIYGIMTGVIFMACFYAAYTIKSLIKYQSIAPVAELFTSLPFVLIMIFWFIGAYVGGEYARKSYLSVKSFISNEYPDIPENQISKLAIELYKHKAMKALWLPLGGFPFAFYVFENRLPTHPLEWILIILCLAVAFYFYKKSHDSDGYN